MSGPTKHPVEPACLGPDIWALVLAQLDGPQVSAQHAVSRAWSERTYRCRAVVWVYESTLEEAHGARAWIERLRLKGCVHFRMRLSECCYYRREWCGERRRRVAWRHRIGYSGREVVDHVEWAYWPTTVRETYRVARVDLRVPGRVLFAHPHFDDDVGWCNIALIGTDRSSPECTAEPVIQLAQPSYLISLWRPTIHIIL
jgi:hypothetical protein